MLDGLKINQDSFTKDEIKKHHDYKLSKAITDKYTYDSQLAIILNSLELIIESIPDSTHKNELKKLLKYRNDCKKVLK